MAKGKSLVPASINGGGRGGVKPVGGKAGRKQAMPKSKGKSSMRY
jgi:hypothetical protein